MTVLVTQQPTFIQPSRLNVGRTGTDIPWRLGSVSCELTCGYLENQLGTLWMVSLSGESRNHDVMSNNSDFLTGGTLAMMLLHQRLATRFMIRRIDTAVRAARELVLLRSITLC
ncbi:hypothetical protein CY34DRAFT_363458 [Suillus luteus UH-Slu-Lm8-n1]|uniref:Uncharacterized protein n=1 Tax=Suillus luteus UH-Slu-Lm8-n1 TaxID=930992 RepID=A0A0D0ALE9_9AGAM|nr:hypothetical protein CY34DRAFT_363458 [Suillus luteus UH-Slu-Lm8-n1]